MSRLGWGVRFYHKCLRFFMSILFGMITSLSPAFAGAPGRSSKRIIITPTRTFSFTKNGKKYLVTKQRNEQGRLIKQSIVGPNSIEISMDLKNRGVFDYWYVERGDLKMTATDPLFGVYRRLEVEKIYPKRGVQKVRFGFNDAKQKYVLVTKSFEKPVVLNQQKLSEAAMMFSGGAIVDDKNKGCGMLNQGYANDLLDMFVTFSSTSSEARRGEYLKELQGSAAVEKTCDPATQDLLNESIADIAVTADRSVVMENKPNQFLACMEDLHLAANAANISSVLARVTCRSGSLIKCDSNMSELGNYSPSTRPPQVPITINPQFDGVPRSKQEVRSTVFHELVHMSGILDENMTYDLQGCCAPPTGDFDFKSKACNAVSRRVVVFSERQGLENLLMGPASSQAYSDYVDLVRRGLGANAKDMIQNTFVYRTDTVFQEELENFSNQVGKNGTCSKLTTDTEKTNCVKKAKEAFVALYKARVSATCHEGTFEAAIAEKARVESSKLTSAKACSDIVAGAGKVVEKYKDVMSFEDYQSKCSRSESNDQVVAKPVVSSAAKAKNASANQAATLLAGQCQVARFVYFDRTGKTEVSDVTSLADNAERESKFEDKRPVSVSSHQDLNSPSVDREVHAAPPSSIAPPLPPSSPELSINPGKFEYGRPAADSPITGLQEERESPFFPASSARATAANLDSAGIKLAPQEYNFGQNESTPSGGKGNMFENLDPKSVSELPDPSFVVGPVLSAVNYAIDSIVPAAYAGTVSPSPGEPLRQAIAGNGGRSDVKNGSRNSSSESGLDNARRPASSGGSGNSNANLSASTLAEPSSSVGQSTSQLAGQSPSTSQSTSQSQNSAKGAGGKTEPKASPEEDPDKDSEDEPGKEKADPKAKTKSVAAKAEPVKTVDLESELKTMTTVADVQKQLVQTKPEDLDRKLRLPSYVTRLIELGVQVIKPDGSMVGSRRPKKIIVFDKDKKKYLMKDVSEKKGP